MKGTLLCIKLIYIYGNTESGLKIVKNLKKHTPGLPYFWVCLPHFLQARYVATCCSMRLKTNKIKLLMTTKWLGCYLRAIQQWL